MRRTETESANFLGKQRLEIAVPMSRDLIGLNAMAAVKRRPAV